MFSDDDVALPLVKLPIVVAVLKTVESTQFNPTIWIFTCYRTFLISYRELALPGSPGEYSR